MPTRSGTRYRTEEPEHIHGDSKVGTKTKVSKGEDTLKPKKRLRFDNDAESFSYDELAPPSKRSRSGYDEKHSSPRNGDSSIPQSKSSEPNLEPTNPSNWLLIIRTYKRASSLLQKTLKYLLETNISLSRIRIIVGSITELQDYINVLGMEWVDRIIIGHIGLKNVNNFIYSHFAEGQELFFLDDDITGLYCRCDDTSQDLSKVLDLEKFVTEGFRECKRVGASLWGVYPVFNPWYMTMIPISYDLRFIAGSAFGIINSRSVEQYCTLDEGEDFERTFKSYLKDGVVVRYNRVGVKTKHNKGKGGMVDGRSLEGMVESKRELARRYPELCKVVCKWKKGQDHDTQLGGEKGSRIELEVKDIRGPEMKGQKKKKVWLMKRKVVGGLGLVIGGAMKGINETRFDPGIAGRMHARSVASKGVNVLTIVAGATEGKGETYAIPVPRIGGRGSGGKEVGVVDDGDIVVEQDHTTTATPFPTTITDSDIDALISSSSPQNNVTPSTQQKPPNPTPTPKMPRNLRSRNAPSPPSQKSKPPPPPPEEKALATIPVPSKRRPRQIRSVRSVRFAGSNLNDEEVDMRPGVSKDVSDAFWGDIPTRSVRRLGRPSHEEPRARPKQVFPPWLRPNPNGPAKPRIKPRIEEVDVEEDGVDGVEEVDDEME